MRLPGEFTWTCVDVPRCKSRLLTGGIMWRATLRLMLHNVWGRQTLELCKPMLKVHSVAGEEGRGGLIVNNFVAPLIKKCAGTRSLILSHHNFLMGCLDDSCQSSICSPFPLSKRSTCWPLRDLHPWARRRERVRNRFLLSRGHKKRRVRFMSAVYLGGDPPPCTPPSFFFFLMCAAKKCFTREQGVKFFSSKWMAISHHLAPEGN